MEVKSINDVTDSDLVRMSLEKDNDAYGELMKRWMSAVLYSAYSVTENEFSAEDIAQEAFFGCWFKLHMLREHEKFGAWVCRVAKNHALNSVTRSVKQTSLDSVMNMSSKGSSPENILIMKETKAQINRALRNLPEKSREAAEMFYITGLSQKQIASLLDIPEGTVKRRLFDARNRLKSELEKLGVLELPRDDERGKKMRQEFIEKVNEKINALQKRLSKNWWDFGEDYKQLLSDAEKAVYGMDESDEKQDALIKLYFYQTFTDTSDEAYEKAINAACERKDADIFYQLIMNACDHGQGITAKIEDNLKHFETVDSFGEMIFWYSILLLNDKNYDEAKKMFRKTMDIFSDTNSSYYANAIAAIKFIEFDEKYGITDEAYSNFNTAICGMNIWNNNGMITVMDQPGWGSSDSCKDDEGLPISRAYYADVLISANVRYREYFRIGMKIGDKITSNDGKCTLEMVSDNETVSVQAAAPISSRRKTLISGSR